MEYRRKKFNKLISWQPQTVDNFIYQLFFNDNKVEVIPLLLISCFLSSCQKTTHIYNQPIHPINVLERSVTIIHPAQFYLCGNAEYPCSVTSYRHAAPLHPALISHHQQKRKAHEKSIAKQTCFFK